VAVLTRNPAGSISKLLLALQLNILTSHRETLSPCLEVHSIDVTVDARRRSRQFLNLQAIPDTCQLI
jgi:hypothetical protein